MRARLFLRHNVGLCVNIAVNEKKRHKYVLPTVASLSSLPTKQNHHSHILTVFFARISMDISMDISIHVWI